MDDFAIDEKSGIPVWVQLRNRLLFLITSGHYRVGDQLPTVHKMAVLLKINYNTVNKVYQSLERDGYIVSKRGQGTFVTEFMDEGDGTSGSTPGSTPGGTAGSTPKSTADLITDEYLSRMKILGLTASDITALVQARLSGSADSRRAPKGKR
jgi:GntR family transcriptional regulator